MLLGWACWRRTGPQASSFTAPLSAWLQLTAAKTAKTSTHRANRAREPSRTANEATPTLASMSSGTGAIERRLTEVSSELRALREELRVTESELRHFADEADDARVRALVSEGGQAERDARDAARHAEAIERQRRHLVAEIERLERTQ